MTIALHAKFAPGDRVAVMDQETVGTVEGVSFRRNMVTALYEVQWMQAGDVISRWFHEQDLAVPEKRN